MGLLQILACVRHLLWCVTLDLAQGGWEEIESDPDRKWVFCIEETGFSGGELGPMVCLRQEPRSGVVKTRLGWEL